MKALTRFTALIAVGWLFTGCCGKNIDVTRLSYGTSTKEEVTDMFGTWSSRTFHYRVHGNDYSFLKYHVPDSIDKVGFLFEDDTLVAAHKTQDWWSTFGYERCIVYPLSTADNAGICFENATRDFIAARHPLATLTFAPDVEIGAFETFAIALEGTTYAVIGYPILMVGAAFMPIYLVDVWQQYDTKNELAAELRLGEPIEKYEKVLDEYPGRIISKNSRSTSILVPAGFLFKQPAYSIGTQDGKIIWLDEKPFSSCSSGFSIKSCELGNLYGTTARREGGTTNNSLKGAAGQAPQAGPEDHDRDDFWNTGASGQSSSIKPAAF